MATVKTVSFDGTLVVHRKNFLSLTDIGAHLVDVASDLFGQNISLQLISTEINPGTKKLTLSKRAAAGGWLVSGGLRATEDVELNVKFEIGDDFGVPGAFTIRNKHPNEFYLKSLTLELPQQQVIEFPCNSWVYNVSRYPNDRIFFSNHLTLPKDTPAGLVDARNQELLNLRGNGTGERKVWERIYDYATYNDLGKPDTDKSLQRPTLGGSAEFPYPRRCRTGRDPEETDKATESQAAGNYYIPSDERFGTTKESNFLTAAIKAAAQSLIPNLESTFTADETFDSFGEVQNLYVEGVDMSKCKRDDDILDPAEVVQSLSTGDSGSLLMYPIPTVIKANEKGWMSDAEFARQMISGLNPMAIQLLEVFPPESTLDPAVYGTQKSAITEEHIVSQLEGNTVQQALENKKLFILDYHDAYLPYLTKINSIKEIHAYASRTLLYLKADGTLKPIAIELSLPPDSSSKSENKRVFLPPAPGTEDWLWHLAKAHVTTNDSGYHQLISHFLRTHACLEPFIIATHRNLSALHPLNPFLVPHFKNTMSINARARQSLINADGIIEKCFSTRRYSMELSSVVYRTWRFDDQGLPADLLKRGMATPDANSKHGLKLAINDYPYAADGLEIWDAIERWTQEYVDSCYEDDADIESDKELQAWWTEIVNVGHGDKKDETWWVEMNSKPNLVSVLTTVIWLASAHHAAVNFGQYAYAGYMPNHPTATHREIPREGSEEHKQLLKDPENFFLSAVSTKAEATSVMTTIEILATHSADEEYLGQRIIQNWTNNQAAQSAFTKFSEKLKAVEELIQTRNKDTKLKNRTGPVQIPYTLLFPSSGPGLTGRGIPNSTSI
ncbi:lipoxygenase [Selaginella moellendorffii]|uniref:Lipoxygenase n=1 Tax=Selaginella moellendorffii TaxID=88036 RepID=D8SDE9_SELML|nr:linoleate 9S-lipoxygenase [Selaginella moellendorffii]EFJ17612.1 lipoxygenase [Selaginella moellendorffii]|eukprot:XP_002981424.1 linoleate 9S-lipoxygenase [Selaginella moellendorffii]